MLSALPKLALATSTVALYLTLPSFAQVPADAPAVPAPAHHGPALWKVADEDTTIYLFGTIHILPPDIEWFDGPIAAAFNGSDEFVTEVDLAAMAGAPPAMIKRATLPEGQTLRSLMSEEDRAEYEAALTRLKLPAAPLDRFKPWFAAMNLRVMILLRNGYRADSGADMFLHRKASAKRQAALETVDFQINMLDTTPMEQQLAYLDDIVGWVPQVLEWNRKLVALWLAGDAEGLAAWINTAYTNPDYYDRILTNRNANWAAWIDERLHHPGTCRC